MAKIYVESETGELLARQKRFTKMMDTGIARLIADKDITGVGLRTLLYLIKSMDYDNVAKCAQSDIVKSVGASRQQVSDALHKMSEKGYISIDATRRPNKFIISPTIAQRGAKKVLGDD